LKLEKMKLEKKGFFWAIGLALRPFGMGDTKTRNPAPPGLRVSWGIFLFGMVPPETPKFFTLFEFAPSVKDVMTGEV
jgi:hypothetical protein